MTYLLETESDVWNKKYLYLIPIENKTQTETQPSVSINTLGPLETVVGTLLLFGGAVMAAPVVIPILSLPFGYAITTTVVAGPVVTVISGITSAVGSVVATKGVYDVTNDVVDYFSSKEPDSTVLPCVLSADALVIIDNYDSPDAGECYHLFLVCLVLLWYIYVTFT
jgi:hypothetical protein